MSAELPRRRPVRPSRCSNDATVCGAPTWMTRSRSPTSIPSSRVDVETITQSRASANASSARRRSSTASEECETYVSTLSSRSRVARLSTPARVSAKTSRFSPRWSRGDHRRGIGQGADVVDLNLRQSLPASAPDLPPRRDSRSRPATRSAGPQHCRPWRTTRPAGAGARSTRNPGQQASRCQPRSSPANAWISSTTTARMLASSTRGSTTADTSMDSRDSGVVKSMSGCSQPVAAGPTASCRRAGSPPSGPATPCTPTPAARDCSEAPAAGRCRGRTSLASLLGHAG